MSANFNSALLAIASSLILTACMTQPPAPVVRRSPEGKSEARSQAATPLPGINLPKLASRTSKPTAMPIKAINASTQCSFHDEIGTKGKLALQIEEASVKYFVAEVSMHKHGTCRFDLKNFRQTEKLPAVVLASSQSNCSVRIWEQGQQLTVAFSNCESYCTGNSFSYLWPILADTGSGECA